MDDAVVAAVERKTLENLSADLVSGKIGFVMAELSTLSAAAVVVEDRYTSIFKSGHVEAGWLAELVPRLQVRYPRVPIGSATTASSPRSGPTASWGQRWPNWAKA